MSRLAYLASPYSDPDPAVQAKRFDQVCRAAAHFMGLGHFVFSPIAHSHPISLHGLRGDWAFWGAFDRMIIERCDEFWVLCLPGWDDSEGIGHELILARELGLCVRFIDWPIEI